MRRAPMLAGTMKLVGGELCLDFVNSVGGWVPEHGRSPRWGAVADKLVDYAELVAWSRHTRSIGEKDARGLLRLAASQPRRAAQVLGRARLLREALYRTLRSLMLGGRPERTDVSRLNREVAAARKREALAPAADGLRWQWPGRALRLDSPLWPVTRSAAALLTSGDLSRLRRCGNDQCGWLFVDRSRNRSRQWCTMENCGNVSKVRRFRRRHLSADGSAGAPSR